MNFFKALVHWAAVVTTVQAQHMGAGPFKGLDPSKDISSTWQSILSAANDDCVEVEAYRLPKHAKPNPLEELDGGSRIFNGDGYVIIVRQSLFPLGNEGEPVKGYLYGYELYLGGSDAVSKGRPIVSRVWFVSAQQMSKVTSANAKELEARIPHDWIRGEAQDHQQSAPKSRSKGDEKSR